MPDKIVRRWPLAAALTTVASSTVPRTGDGALAATWILAAGFIGLLGDVTSISGAALVLGLGLVPPVLLIIVRAVQGP